MNQTWLSYTRYFGGRTTSRAIPARFRFRLPPQGPPGLPQIAVTGYFTLGQSIAGPVAGDNIYSIRDTLSFTRGRHSLRFGGEFGLSKDIQQTLLNNYGVFSFTGAKTGPKTNQGDAFADMLLGLPVTMNQDAPENGLLQLLDRRPVCAGRRQGAVPAHPQPRTAMGCADAAHRSVESGADLRAGSSVESPAQRSARTSRSRRPRRHPRRRSSAVEPIPRA